LRGRFSGEQFFPLFPPQSLPTQEQQAHREQNSPFTGAVCMFVCVLFAAPAVLFPKVFSPSCQVRAANSERHFEFTVPGNFNEKQFVYNLMIVAL